MHGKPREWRQRRDGAGGGTEIPDSGLSANRTRTSGADGRSCRGCGDPLTGRQRNWCGDPYRMRARRAAKQARVEHKLAKIERVVEGWRPNVGGSEAESVREELLNAIDSIRGELRSSDGHLFD